MERIEMIDALMKNAEFVLDNVLDYDPTTFEKKELLEKERARLELKTDQELENMVLINC